jgi:hypothetical protein
MFGCHEGGLVGNVHEANFIFDWCKLPFQFTKPVHQDLEGKEVLAVGVGVRIRVMGPDTQYAIIDR